MPKKVIWSAGLSNQVDYFLTDGAGCLLEAKFKMQLLQD